MSIILTALQSSLSSFISDLKRHGRVSVGNRELLSKIMRISNEKN